MELYTQLIGYLALLVWFFSRMPQIRQMYITKSVDDINFTTLFLDFVGSLLYLTYSLLIQDTVILVASIQPMIFNITMIILWKLYTKSKSIDANIDTDTNNCDIIV